jgi:hypothetical protein
MATAGPDEGKRTSMATCELWTGVDLKIANSEFFLAEMGRSFELPPGGAARAAAVGLNVEMPLQWQRSFYARLDAFLVTARSVPEVINCCFGKDTSPAMNHWFGTLCTAEQSRRADFSKQFRTYLKNFRALPLSNERNISFHRSGYPSVEGTDALKWAATLPPTPIRATLSDFTIGGRPLAGECRVYLEAVTLLATRGRTIAATVHGTNHLSPPP